jgi:hypothetical protein
MIAKQSMDLAQGFARRNYLARLKRFRGSLAERQMMILSAEMATTEERSDAERVLRKLGYSDSQIVAARRR